MGDCAETGKKAYARLVEGQKAARRTGLKNVGRTPFWINQEADRKFRADRAMSRLL